MKKLLIFIGLTLVAAVASAQPANPSIVPVSADPTGNACTAGVPMLYYSGTYYGCDGTGHYAALGGGGGSFSYPGILKGTSSTTSEVATGDTDYQSVLSTPGAGALSPFAIQANNVAALNYQKFSDGTPFYSAGPSYASIGAFIADNTFTCQTNPTRCSADLLFNYVDKFMANVNANGEIPILIPQNLTVTVGDYFSAWDLRGKAGLGSYATGDGRIFVPQDLYLACKKVGVGSSACKTEYAAHVEAIKTAWNATPRDATTHLYQVVPGDEYVCGAAFQEYMRLTGLVASCNVWAAIVDADMLELATAAGDSTNITYFTNDLALLVAGIRANLINGTTGLLKAATIQNSANDDIPSSALAIYADASPVMAHPGILTSGQKTTIENYFNTNFSSLVNSQGFVIQTPLAGGWGTVGYIPTSGGPPYGGSPYSGTQYQGGYWTFQAAWFAYAVGQVDATKVSTMLNEFVNGLDPAQEWYNQGSTSVPAGSTTPYMNAPQWAVEAATLFPFSLTLSNGVSCINKYGAQVNSGCSTTGTTTNAVTFNNGGAGAASDTTFDGSVARVISYNTLGALADPGSNGVVKRTAANTTAVSTFSDIVAMWASGACSSGYLRFDGTCSTPSGTSPLTSKGDLYTHDASADARLAVGADGQCLVADSTQPNGIKWGSCSGTGGGAWTNLCSSVTLTNATCTSGKIVASGTSPITISAIPGTYLNLDFSITGSFSSTGPAELFITYNSDTTSGHYRWGRYGSLSSDAVSHSADSGGGGVSTSFGGCYVGGTDQPGGGCRLQFPSYADTTTYKTMLGSFVAGASSTSMVQGTTNGIWTSNSAITSMSIALGSGTFVNTYITLYGSN